MNRIFIIISIFFMCSVSVGQVTVAVYNNNNATYYQKLLTSNIVAQINLIKNYSAINKTEEYGSLLQNNPNYKQSAGATDAMLATLAATSDETFVCNIKIKDNESTNNIVATLVNLQTGITEQSTATTCKDLFSVSALDKAAQDIVNKLIVTPLAKEKRKEEEAKELAEQKNREERELAEQKNNEEKAKAEQKVKEEKELAEQKAKEEKAIAEQKAKEEKVIAKDPTSQYNFNKLVFDGRKMFFNGRIVEKKEVRSMMVNTDALRLYNKGIKQRNGGTAQLVLGSIVVCAGIVAMTLSLTKYSRTEDVFVGYEQELVYDGDGYLYYVNNTNAPIYHHKNSAGSLFYPGVGIAAAGGVLLISGGSCYGVGKKNIKRAITSYNHRTATTARIEWGLGVTQNGMGLLMRF